MKKRLIASLLSLSVIILLGANYASASFGPIATSGDIANVQTQLNNLSSELAALKNTVGSNFVFGANNTQPIAGTNYSLAGSGVSASAGSIVLTSFTITQTNVPITASMLSKNFYITLEPGNNARQEIASCTGVTQNSNGTATLTNCSRGLLPFPPYTASSSYAFPHGGGTTLILSNPPQLYNELAALGNTESITGLWTFASSTIPQVSSDTTNAQDGISPFNLATVGYVASTSFAGVANASLIQKGIVQEATQAQMAAASTTGSTGADLVQSNRFSSLTASTSPVSVIASGTLSSTFLLNGNYALGSTTAQSLNVASETFSNATSGVLSVNTNGNVSSIQTLTSGNILVASGTTWTSATSSASNSYLVPATIILNGSGVATSATTTATASFNLKYAGRILIIYNGSAVNTTDNDNCSFSTNINGSGDGGTLAEIINNSGGPINGYTNVGFSHISTILLPAGNNTTTVSMGVGGATCNYVALALQIEYIGQ